MHNVHLIFEFGGFSPRAELLLKAQSEEYMCSYMQNVNLVIT